MTDSSGNDMLSDATTVLEQGLTSRNIHGLRAATRSALASLRQFIAQQRPPVPEDYSRPSRN